MKNSFVLYTDYLSHIELLTMEQRGSLLTAIMYHASGMELPDMDGMTEMAFSFIRAQMDKDNEKYERIVESRREAGKKGGRPSEEKANGFSEKQNKAKKANGFSEKQNKAKKPDNDNVNDNDNDNVNKLIDSKAKALLTENDEPFSSQYTTIRELYNSVCGSYPRLVKLSDARKKAIKARLRSGYTIEDFKKLFEMAESSDFLKGKNKRNWSPGFDWLISDTNMAKVLEGNYNNRKEDKPNAGWGSAEDYYRQYLEDGDS